MKDYIFNTTDRKIDTSEIADVLTFACKHLNIENPLLKILSATRNKIINTSVLQFLSIGVTMHAHWYCQAFDDFICRPSGNDF